MHESIVTKCLEYCNIFRDIHESNEDFYFLQYIHIYVRTREDECVDGWRMKLFDSFGGKTHIGC